MNDYLALLLGVVCAGIGGEAFIRGAVVAIICPISVDWRGVVVALVFGLLAVVCTFPARDGLIGRGRGAWLLVLYGLYLALLFQTHSA